MLRGNASNCHSATAHVHIVSEDSSACRHVYCLTCGDIVAVRMAYNVRKGHTPVLTCDSVTISADVNIYRTIISVVGVGPEIVKRVIERDPSRAFGPQDWIEIRIKNRLDIIGGDDDSPIARSVPAADLL